MPAKLYLRKALPQDIELIKIAYLNSAEIHPPWTYPPRDYDEYVSQENRYLLCADTDDQLVGTFNLSGIVRGYFQSAYLGYEVFSPFQGKGYMKKGLSLIIEEAFEKLQLHRLEANIQPENTRSIRMVKAAGFVKEGFSKQYLNIGGQGWKDHERWALINNNWQEANT